MNSWRALTEFELGNYSQPNTFTNRLFANLRDFNGGVPQILRIGGNTQYTPTLLYLNSRC
jgi:hypothetical protein